MGKAPGLARIGQRGGGRKAIFWFVSDFVDEHPTRFKARAMETGDEKLIELLDDLIDYYYDRAQPVGGEATEAPLASAGAAPLPTGETPA